MNRQTALLLLLLLSLTAGAQRRFVVVDVETRTPIRGVNVTSSSHRADTTDWRGFVVVDDSCRTLSLTHVKYESRILNTDEVADTIFLISKLMGLPEITVFGQGKDDNRLKELRRQMRADKTEQQLAAADPSRGFNVLGLLQKLFKRRKDKRRQRLQKMLEDY